MLDFENSSIRLWIDRSIRLMYAEWLRPVTSEEYREANSMLLDLLNEHNVQHCIVDSSKLGDITPDDERWTMEHFIPAIIASKLQKMARVSGEDKASMAKFEQFASKAEPIYLGNIQVRQFITYKEALDWIGNVPV